MGNNGHRVRSADLANMSDEQFSATVAELGRVACGLPNGGLANLNDEISEYERRYEISSARLLEELASGTRRETDEICSWLIRLRRRDRAQSRQARA